MGINYYFSWNGFDAMTGVAGLVDRDHYCMLTQLGVYTVQLHEALPKYCTVLEPQYTTTPLVHNPMEGMLYHEAQTKDSGSEAARDEAALGKPAFLLVTNRNDNELLGEEVHVPRPRFHPAVHPLLVAMETTNKYWGRIALHYRHSLFKT
jgi:hypothetical protein